MKNKMRIVNRAVSAALSISGRFIISITAWFLIATHLSAQNIAPLYTFMPENLGTNADGAVPKSGLLFTNGLLYGTTAQGSSNGFGSIFSIAPGGSAFTVLHAFNNSVALDGSDAQGTLFFSGNTLYGVASHGGTNDTGTIFSLGTNGENFSALHNFASSDGKYPVCVVLDTNGLLYGAANEGGTNSLGTLFSIDTNGTAFTVLYTFQSHGHPQGDLLLAGDTLYGTDREGGTNGSGGIFSYNISQRTFTNFYSFPSSVSSGGPPYTNADGSSPESGLTLAGGTLYGSAAYGGPNGSGVLFSVSTNGANFTVIHTFSPATGSTNLDGIEPQGTLFLLGNRLYGTATSGGMNGSGTIFAVNTNGTDFNSLYAFAPLNPGLTNDDGANPETGVILQGKTLYGAALGGTNANGVLIALPIQPVISHSVFAGTNLILNAENGLEGESCSLLASTNLSLPLVQWTPLTTNTLTTGGSFTISATNAASPGAPAEFYSIRAQ